MVEATIEDLAITIRSSRETIWGYPHIVCEDVLSTTLLKNKRSGQAREQRLEWKRLGVNVRSSEPPRRAVRNGAKNLHGSKTIPKSLYQAFWYHGNGNAYQSQGCLDLPFL